MFSNTPRILLTGLPGCGKTTAVMRIVAALSDRKLAGFYTEEIRDRRTRKGFKWKRLDGPEGILSHTGFKGPKVGKYGVDVPGFESRVVPILDPQGSADLFVIDEIGKMECLSAKFTDAVRRLLDSEKPLLATIAKKGGGFISQAKAHPAVSLYALTESNRTELADDIVHKFRDAL